MTISNGMATEQPLERPPGSSERGLTIGNTCPHLGLFWDPTLRTCEPDRDNRCATGFRWVRFLWLLKRKRRGGLIDIAHQTAYCYRDFRRCPHFAADTATEPGVSASAILPQ
jgi:hypothetical protein